MKQSSFPSEIIARAPAKVMLAGEYAVLAGKPALSACLDLWLTARLKPYDKPGILVHSNLWPEAQLLSPAQDPHSLKSTPLMHALAFAARKYQMGAVELEIDSSIEVAHGIGSSSAMRLSVALAFAYAAKVWKNLTPLAWSKNPKFDPHASEIFEDPEWGAARLAFYLQREAQGSASGYDIATQKLGGLIEFWGSEELKDWPAKTTPLSHEFKELSSLIHVYVGGAGSSTAPLTMGTRAWLSSQGLWNEFVLTSEKLVELITQSLRKPINGTKNHLLQLFQACAKHRSLLEPSPQFPKHIANALKDIEGLDKTFSWKTTGAGGDDAILLIGAREDLEKAHEALESLGRRPIGCRWTFEGAKAYLFEHSPDSQKSTPFITTTPSERTSQA